MLRFLMVLRFALMLVRTLAILLVSELKKEK